MIYKATIYERIVSSWRKRKLAEERINAPDNATAAEIARRVAREKARDRRHTWFTLEAL